MIDILLINPQPVVMKDLFAENLMYANPLLGLGYLASAARNAGCLRDCDNYRISCGYGGDYYESLY